MLNGYPFPVTGNLKAALLQLRLPSSGRAVWIDAICIDQKNDPGRSHQVALMRKIYQLAVEVIAWLGIEKDNSKVAFDLLHGMLERPDAADWFREILTSPDQVTCLLTLIPLYSRPYW
jgi:hypothetical protein